MARIHVNLAFLGPSHQTEAFTLQVGGKRYPLQRHTAETLAQAPAGKSPTHFTEADSSEGTLQLITVKGAPDPSTGISPLSAVYISTGGEEQSYDASDIAGALVFLHPSLTVLTPDAAQTVLNHINSTSSILQLTADITALGAAWNTTTPLLDENGQPITGPSGNPLCTYDLPDRPIGNSRAAAANEAKIPVYSDDTLQGIRWNLQEGSGPVDVSSSGGAVAASLLTEGPDTASDSPYEIEIQDPGPAFGLSAAATIDATGLVTLTLTNTYIRHLSVFVQFLEPDNQTPISISDEDWYNTYLQGATASEAYTWYGELQGTVLIGSDTVKFLGNVGSESTFLGIPVASSSSTFTFTLPDTEHAIGKIRVLAGSLGVSSGNDCDPMAAWIGIGETVFVDILMPTYAIAATVGEETSTIYDSIFKDKVFAATVIEEIYAILRDVINGSPNTGGEIEGDLIALVDNVVGKLLTSKEVIAALVGFLTAEEIEEAIPIVGWALKALSLEGAVSQLAQTICEVTTAPRIVEFDLAVTLTTQVTLTPDMGNSTAQPEFAATATTFLITAQYSDNTARTFTGDVADPKVPSLVASWDGVPIGGTVTFLASLYSQEGHLVGKGQSATIANIVPEGETQLAVSIPVTQLLYPLDSSTTYQHSQLLQCDGSAYSWTQTPTPPNETVKNLGTGPATPAAPHILEGLVGITINQAIGLLGYTWLAAGLGVEPVGGGDPNEELYAFKNIATGIDPDAGVMNTPAGYQLAPQLVYLRSSDDSPTFPTCLFVDPSGDATNGFHLREIAPVTDPSVALSDPSRQFNLATGASWGRFPFLPTSAAIHARGYVVGIAPGCQTIQVLQLPDAAVDDADAPWAMLRLGPGTRAGLIQDPQLVAISPDQIIYILEAGNQRIQAFNWGGHPVPAFPQSDTPYWIPLTSHGAPSTTAYLSLSTDVKGYLFLLSRLGDGYDATDFWLDVYAPTGALLFSQNGLVAGAMTVDLWRNLYTLNFQMISGADGRTEPSVSEWIPSTPN